MAEELSVEETNAMRAALGLKPLRVSGQKANVPALPEARPSKPLIPKKKRVKTEEKVDLTKASEGEVLILQERDILDDDEEEEVLIRPNELKRRATAKEKLLSQMLSDNVRAEEEEMAGEEKISGARLFVSDLKRNKQSSLLLGGGASKPKRARAKPVAPQVKIDRAQVGVLGEDEDEMELQALLTTKRKQVVTSAMFAPQLPPPVPVQAPEELVPLSRIERMEEEVAPVLKPAVADSPLVTLPMEKGKAAPTAAPQHLTPKEKPSRFHRRSLSTTLSLINSNAYAVQQQELIVGRAKDVKPIADLNKPGDLVNLEYRDDHGRLLTTKEAYRQLKYQFRGDGPGPRKKMLREAQLQRMQAARSGTGAGEDAALPSAKDLVSKVKKDHIVLWKN